MKMLTLSTRGSAWTFQFDTDEDCNIMASAESPRLFADAYHRWVQPGMHILADRPGCIFIFGPDP
jgi:hypothetical protein